MGEQQPVLLRLQNIDKSFGKKAVLRNFDLSIRRGENTLIHGPSGSGKTTILRILSLLESVDRGHVWYNNTDVTAYATHYLQASRLARLQLGYVSQNLDLWPHLTVEENIGLALRLRGLKPNDVQGRIDDVLIALGVWDERLAYPAFLSGGQRQRVALARSFVQLPDVLLLDEIVSNLDQDNANKVFEALRHITGNGATLVLVTHSPNVPDVMFTTRVVIHDKVEGE